MKKLLPLLFLIPVLSWAEKNDLDNVYEALRKNDVVEKTVDTKKLADFDPYKPYTIIKEYKNNIYCENIKYSCSGVVNQWHLCKAYKKNILDKFKQQDIYMCGYISSARSCYTFHNRPSLNDFQIDALYRSCMLDKGLSAESTIHR
jgi:hypothetical protein